MGNNKQNLTHSEVLRMNFGYKEAETEKLVGQRSKRRGNLKE